MKLSDIFFIIAGLGLVIGFIGFIAMIVYIAVYDFRRGDYASGIMILLILTIFGGFLVGIVLYNLGL